MQPFQFVLNTAINNLTTKLIIFLVASAFADVIVYILAHQHTTLLGPCVHWRYCAPAHQATRLGGLKHSPPLIATHLSGIVGGLYFERPLSTTNKMAVFFSGLLFSASRVTRHEQFTWQKDSLILEETLGQVDRVPEEGSPRVGRLAGEFGQPGHPPSV